MTSIAATGQDARRRRTVTWVVTLATVGLIFDGYDLVVYGVVVPIFLRDASQIGEVTPAVAGTLGSYALLGMLFGALLAGGVGDILGRRRVMLTAYAWFSIGMLLTSLMTTTTMFGVMRFLTGLGIGALIATTGALVAEFAPPWKKNLCNAITYSGVPLGSLLGALIGIVLLEFIGWRGMFMIGALPILTLLPLAFLKMPESVSWLVARGEIDKARAISERSGMPMPDSVPQSVHVERAGFAGLFSRRFGFATVLVGIMSAAAQFLNYYLNTWLPALMERSGYNAKGSLAFLLVLSGGAILGALTGSRFADRFGPKPIVAFSFLIGAVSIALLTLDLPLAVRLLFVAVVGLGTTGTSIMIYGLVANHFPTKMRGAAVAWAAGFGRLGGVSGPLLGGLLLAAGFTVNSSFYVLAGLAVGGALLTLAVPHAHRPAHIQATTVEPTVPVATGTSSGSPTR
jgi:AAHS family benzoate transporter-like MFS transporter